MAVKKSFLLFIFLSLFLFLPVISFSQDIGDANKRLTADGATVGLIFQKRNPKKTPRDEMFILIHGLNSVGEMWYSKNEDVDWVYQLTESGYDVAVLYKRHNYPDELGEKGWHFGYEDEQYDVAAGVREGMEYFNNINSVFPDEPNRNKNELSTILSDNRTLNMQMKMMTIKHILTKRYKKRSARYIELTRSTASNFSFINFRLSFTEVILDPNYRIFITVKHYH